MYRRSTVIAIWSLLAGRRCLPVFVRAGQIRFLSDLPVSIFYRLHLSGLRHHASLAPDSSRSFSHCVHAQSAFSVSIPFLLFAFLRYSIIVLRGGVPRPNALPAPYIYAMFFIVVSFWIFRNTPFYPFVS